MSTGRTTSAVWQQWQGQGRRTRERTPVTRSVAPDLRRRTTQLWYYQIIDQGHLWSGHLLVENSLTAAHSFLSVLLYFPSDDRLVPGSMDTASQWNQVVTWLSALLTRFSDAAATKPCIGMVARYHRSGHPIFGSRAFPSDSGRRQELAPGCGAHLCDEQLVHAMRNQHVTMLPRVRLETSN